MGIIVVKSICEQFLLFSAVIKYYEESEELSTTQNTTVGASREWQVWQTAKLSHLTLLEILLLAENPQKVNNLEHKKFKM